MSPPAGGDKSPPGPENVRLLSYLRYSTVLLIVIRFMFHQRSILVNGGKRVLGVGPSCFPRKHEEMNLIS